MKNWTSKYKPEEGLFPSTGMLTSVGSGPKVPTMNYGGDISLPNVYPNAMVPKYGPGGAVTDGCPPNWHKNAMGQCELDSFTMPRNSAGSSGRVFHNPIVNNKVDTSTIGYQKPIQTKPKKKQVSKTKVVTPSKNILGKNVSSSTQAPRLYNPIEIQNINTNSTLGKQQQEILIKAGQSPAAAKLAVGSKKFLPSQQEILNKNAQLTYRVTNHPNYNPSKSIEEQAFLGDDNSLLTRINRGSRASSSTNPVQNFAWEVMSAPGKGFNNLFLEKNHYANEGWKAPVYAGLDLISMAPGVGEAAATGIRSAVGRQFLGKGVGVAERNLAKTAAINIAEHEAPALKRLGHHFTEMGEEGIKHKGAHTGIHNIGEGHEEDAANEHTPKYPLIAGLNTKVKINKYGGSTGNWTDKYKF